MAPENETATKTEVLPAVQQASVPATVDELTVDQLVAQSQLIHEAMSKALTKGVHYGTIPGVQKPTLLKPGAEKLCLLFRLDPEYEILQSVRTEKEISYVVRCTLNHITTGNRVSSGLGSCTSMEKKYRYRFQVDESKPEPSREEREVLKAQGMGANRQIKGIWKWAWRTDAEPYDVDNTVLKMACKRALVAAVLNGTAASDVFSQDVEDLEAAAPAAPEAVIGPLRDELLAQMARLKGMSGWSEKEVLGAASSSFGRPIGEMNDMTATELQNIINVAKTVQPEEKK